MQMTGAQLIVRLLERQGVRTVAGIPGGAILPLYDALSDSDNIRHVLARHEQGAGFMAQGMARASGRPEVCFASSGPGATNLVTASLYANPREVPNSRTAAAALSKVIPELRQDEVEAKLASDKSFVWLKRNLTPKQQYAVNRLGIPGLSFQREERRVYPHGSLAAHIIGFTDIDNHGIAGIERQFESRLAEEHAPLALSMDIRLQHILREELSRSVHDFNAIGGAGVVLDAKTGEVLAMVSLPDFDPNEPGRASADTRFNRATLGVYEMGSVFKVFTTAMALDAGVTSLKGGYDASHPIKVARYTITDYHAKNRWLSVPEIFIYSSNIGSAKMALDVGPEGQRAFLKKLGMLSPVALELPELGDPQGPAQWKELAAMTIATIGRLMKKSEIINYPVKKGMRDEG